MEIEPILFLKLCNNKEVLALYKKLITYIWDKFINRMTWKIVFKDKNDFLF